MASSNVDFRNKPKDGDEVWQKKRQANLEGITSAGNWATGIAVVFCVMAFVSVTLFFTNSHIR